MCNLPRHRQLIIFLMWKFLVKNKQVAAMLGLLAVAALVVILLTSRGSGYSVVSRPLQETEDISEDPHVFTTHSLPSDDRFMPSIGNGHIATNIFSDTVYMNGLYNGYKGESRRARIPAWGNVRLNSTLTHHPYSPVYSLDTMDGVFRVRVERERSVVHQRIYAHKFYTRAIINQIEVVSKPNVDHNFVHHEIWIAIKLMAGADSADIAFEPPRPHLIKFRSVWNSCGRTKAVEDPDYQTEAAPVCVWWTSVPDNLVVPQHGSTVFTFAMTADPDNEVAMAEMVKVLQEDEAALLRLHAQSWRRQQRSAGLDLRGNLALSKAVSGIWYYMLSSLPSDASHQPPNKFYGLSPTGLARGGSFDDYEGHNFWDTEFWMFPPLLLLRPAAARVLLQYRLDRAHVAADLARAAGSKGYRFPWESAFTGAEVTQPCCPEVAEFEHHVTACVAFAARQYLAVSRDEAWLKNGGCALVRNIADYWASRAVINYTTGLYDISNVMGPDEDHSNVTNSVFTNVIAGYSLYLAQYVACLSKSYYMSKDPSRWADIAWSLSLPYDPARDYHPQFAGYRRGERVKQADAVLLGFPLQYPMNDSTRANDLHYYESATRASGPALTWSMHAVGHLRLGDNLQAARLFNRSYADYVREPFKVWSELRRPQVGAVNFLTGMGGLLQALVFGYGGVSVHLDRLELRRPQLPPEATEFRIRGLQYLGANLTLEILLDKTTLTVAAMDETWPLTFDNGNYTVPLHEGITVTLAGEGPFIIRSKPWKNCKPPRDIIGQNYLRPMDTD